MEKVTRMDGLSENLVNVLLNLIRMIVEGKMRIQLMTELKTFLGYFSEKAKFFQFMKKEYSFLLREYEKFFEILWNKPIASGTYPIMQYLLKYPNMHAWKTVRVEHDDNWSPEMVDSSDLLDYEYVLMMNKEYFMNWKKPGCKMEILLNEFKKNHNERCTHIVRFDYDENNKELQLIFFELCYLNSF